MGVHMKRSTLRRIFLQTSVLSLDEVLKRVCVGSRTRCILREEAPLRRASV